MSSTAARVGGVAAPLVVTTTVKVFSSMPLLIFGIFAFAAGMATTVLPETLGKEAPETVADCENNALEGEAVEMKTIHADTEESGLVSGSSNAQEV